jgi:hypothetical protein
MTTRPRRWKRAAAAVQRVATVELDVLANGDLLNHFLRDAEVVNEVVVQHLDAPLGDRAHCEFLMPGDAELAHEKYVERNAELACDFVGHRHAAPRQSEYNDVGTAGVPDQRVREPPAGIKAIEEAHNTAPFARIDLPHASASACRAFWCVFTSYRRTWA